MTGTSGIGFGTSMAAGAVLAVAVAVGAYFTYQTVMVPDEVPMPVLAPVPKPVAQSEPAAPQTVPQTAPPEASQPDATPEPVAEVAPVSSPEATPDSVPVPVADATPDPVPVPTADPAISPSFDVVRVEPDGSSVIAGNATPNAVVSILLDGIEVGQATADGQGNFVALLDVPSRAEAQVLSLSSKHADDAVVVSNDSVILAPVVPTAPVPAVVAQADPEAQVTALEPAPLTPVPSAEPDVPEAVEAPVVEAIAAAPVTEPTTPTAPVTEPTPTAPAVLLANEQGVQVIQPAERSPEVMDNVVIDAISYDALGEVQLSGRGANPDTDEQGAPGFVRVYLNDAPIQTIPIGADGDWHTALPNVDTGVYVLRVDQVDASGAVTSRTQTPFKRETAEVLANAQAADPAQQITAVTVQPGSTLWAIARDRYGDGMLYVRVFEANSDSIRNPDLIYPGQVFQVPE